MMMEKKDYYTVAEFAERAGFSKVGIYKMIRDGRLSAVKVGSSYRISHHVLKTRLRSGPLK